MRESAVFVNETLPSGASLRESLSKRNEFHTSRVPGNLDYPTRCRDAGTGPVAQDWVGQTSCSETGGSPGYPVSKNEKQNNDEDDSANTDIHLQLLSFQC